MKIHYNNFILWKRVMLFSIILICSIAKSQIIIRNSDLKKFDSITISKHNLIKKINLKNLKDYIYTDGDKVIDLNKTYDFTIFNDTLLFFDKTQQIEEIQIIKSINEIKATKKRVKSKKGKGFASIFPNNLIATLIKINSAQNFYIKSFSLFSSIIANHKNIDGKLEIKLLNNINNLPNDINPLLEFNLDLSKIDFSSKSLEKKWEINLPKIIKYPENGFFIVLQLKSNNNNLFALRINDETEMLMYYPKENIWKKMSNGGYYYELKIIK